MKVQIPVTIPAYAEVELDEVDIGIVKDRNEPPISDADYQEYATEKFEEDPREYVICGEENTRRIADPKDATIIR